jgi:riboflavin transporter FmnP
MLAAIAFLLMAAVQLPLLPSAPYLTYDPSDAVALLGGVLYGPGAGVTVVVLKDLLFLLLRARNPIGPIADCLAAATFVGVAAWAYRRAPGPFGRRLARAAALATGARVVVMIPANFVLLGLQFGMPPARVAGLLLPALVPFNALKAALNAVLALLLAEPVFRAVGARLVRGSAPDGPGGTTGPWR